MLGLEVECILSDDLSDVEKISKGRKGWIEESGFGAIRDGYSNEEVAEDANARPAGIPPSIYKIRDYSDQRNQDRCRFDVSSEVCMTHKCYSTKSY